MFLQQTLQYSQNNRLVREVRPPERLHFAEKYNGPNKTPYAIDLMAISEQPEPIPVAPKPEPKQVAPVGKTKNGYNIPAYAP